MRTKLFILMALLFLSLQPGRAVAAISFEDANKLYEEGKFAAAADAYDQLIAAGGISASLYYNEGNSLFKLGRIGRAVEAYRQAQYLAPRDGDIRANLRAARIRARGGGGYRPSRWLTALEVLSLNEWTLLCEGSIWILFLLLAAREWRTELKRELNRWLIVSGSALILTAVGTGAAYYQNCVVETAIITAGEAEVRNGPLDESQPLFKVRDGAEFTVIDRKDNWLQIADSSQRTGWLKQDQALIFTPAGLQKSK